MGEQLLKSLYWFILWYHSSHLSWAVQHPLSSSSLGLSQESHSLHLHLKSCWGVSGIGRKGKPGQTLWVSVTGIGAGPFSPLSHKPDWRFPFMGDPIGTPSWPLEDSTSGLQKPQPPGYKTRGSTLPRSGKNLRQTQTCGSGWRITPTIFPKI